MTTQVDVCNQALDNIGAGLSITSLSPPLPAPNAERVARHYQPKVDALSRAAHWNCLRRQVALTLTRAALGTPENPAGTTLLQPPRPWLYEYAYPADCLAARFLVPDPPTSTGTNPPIFPSNIGLLQTTIPLDGWKFAVGVNVDPNQPTDPNALIKVIWTDLEFADLVYTARIANPDLWDPHFLLAATATLGAWLVNPTNMNQVILKGQVEIASSIVTQARISDGNEGATSVDHLPDWMRIREQWGLGYGPPGLGQSFFGWSTLAFPSGAFI